MNHEGFPGIDASPWYAELDDSQMGAIKLCVRSGWEIQRQIPQIANDYLSGASKRELVEKYQIQEKFGIKNPLTAENAVASALFGYDGRFNFSSISPYTGLISEYNERMSLARRHQSETGKKAAKDKTGMHAWTFEQKSAHSKKNVAAEGFVPYSESEIARIGELAALPEYRLNYGSEGRVSTKKVAAQINIEFHNGQTIRTPDAIVDVVQNLNKQGKIKPK